MTLPRKCAAVAFAAALATLPTAAYSHEGTHPFASCPEAYANGYANIPRGDEHYAPELDGDKDGIGCDNPPEGFVPAPTASASSTAPTDKAEDVSLAETGSTTTVLTVSGLLGLFLGAGIHVLVKARRQRRKV